MKIKITLFAALCAGVLFATGCASGVSTSSADRAGLKAALEAYVGAGDERDVSALDAATHPDFRVMVQFKGSEKVSIMTKGAYLGLVRAGKIGGIEREIAFHEVEARGDVGSARVTLRSKVLRFHSNFSFIRQNGRWRVIQDSVLAEKI